MTKVDALKAILLVAWNNRLSKRGYQRLTEALPALGLDADEQEKMLRWLEFHNAETGEPQAFLGAGREKRA